MFNIIKSKEMKYNLANILYTKRKKQQQKTMCICKQGNLVSGTRFQQFNENHRENI